MNISTIIVNYRTPGDSADAVDGALKELGTFPDGHVYVVDNDSRDGSVETLKSEAIARHWGDRVTVIAAEHNGGYGYGINVGIAYALRTRDPLPDYFYILNPDAIPDAGAIAGQWQFMQNHPDAGVAGCVVHSPDGSVQGAAFRFPSAWSELESTAGVGVISKLLAGHVVSMVTPQDSTEVDWVPGTSMLIRRAVVDQIGKFDEGFFLYFEEADFCRRARNAGWKVVFIPGAGVSHIGSVSTGMGDTTRRMPDYWFESRHRYFVKHHGRRYAALADGAFMLGRGVNLLKERVKPRSPNLRPQFDRDFLRHSARVMIDPPNVANVEAPHVQNGAPQALPDATTSMTTLPLLIEDCSTYGWQLTEPGLWAVLAHRLGARSTTATSPIVKAALSASHRTLATAVDWVWGIQIPKGVRLGRRVRLWHNGCMQLNAKAIGNDVQIRHDTTLGTVRANDPNASHLPVIEDNVELGAGVCVLGDVRVGHGAFVGANSLVLKSVPANATVVGVPARIVPK